MDLFGKKKASEKKAAKEDATVKAWSFHDAKVNLAALLNDPGRSRRDHDLFTKTWGDDFKDLTPGTLIPKSIKVPSISAAHFRDYLDRTSDKYLRHQSQNIQSSSDEENGDYQEGSTLIFQTKSDLRRSSLNNKSNSIHILQQQKKIQAATRLALDTIPKMFLRNEFALEDQHTFSAVLNFTSNLRDSDRIHPKTVSSHEISSSKLLQERLSHYLDLVEVAIVRQISVQSDAFFDAMASHEDLNDYLTKMLASVHQLRLKVTSIRDKVSQKSFKVVHLQCQKKNRAILLEKLRTMITVHQAQPTIQLLLSTSEYAGALDLIETTQEVLKQELAGLHCFRHLGSQLTEMENVIGHMMQEELSSCIQNDLHRPLTEGSSTLNPHHLTAIALGLLRRKKLNFFEEFREEVKLAVKAIIKSTVMDSVIAAEEDMTVDTCKEEVEIAAGEEGPPKERSETLAERMRSLPFQGWINLLNDIFHNLTLFLRRVKCFLAVIVNVACVSTNSSVKQSLREKTKKQPCEEETTNGSEETELNTVNALSNGLSRPNHTPVTSPDPIAPSDNVWDDMDQYEVQLMESVTTERQDLDCGTQANPVGEVEGGVGDTANGKSETVDVAKEQEDSFGITASRDILLSEEEHNELMQSLCENLLWAADFAHDRCVKVIIAKNKDSSLDKLTSSQFLALAQSIETYLTDTELVMSEADEGEIEKEIEYFQEYFSSYHGSSSRGGGVLRGVLQSQASRFITRFHEERRNKLSLILDNETWKQSEVPAELASLLQDMSKKPKQMPPPPSSNTEINGNSPTQTVLIIDGVEYAVVGTVLLLLKMVSEYVRCADDLPASTPDLVTRVSDLLTLFNSRTCQLVLGAGALQLAGLKTISTRNLGLASRCLQLVLQLLPSVRLQFREKIVQFCQSSKSKQLNVLKHFHHVEKDYKDHIAEINSKLVSIMDSAIEHNLSRWEVKAPMPSPQFRTVCKQFAKLHEMIVDLLPEEQIQKIMLDIHLRFKKKLRQKLQQYGVRKDGGPQYGLVMSDIAFYQGSIKNMKIFTNGDLQMGSVWT